MAGKDNKMRKIRIEKVTLNIGCGGDHDKIEKAKKLLFLLTNQQPVVTKSVKRSTFGVGRGKPVGVKVTLRKKRAEDFFKRVMESRQNTVKSSEINDRHINIGIKEYIELPGIKYQYDIGMMGLNVTISLERPGYRVERRKVKKTKIGKTHKINREDVVEWLKERGVKVVWTRDIGIDGKA